MRVFRKALLAVLLVSSLAVGADDESRFRGLEDKFVCLCGCNMGTLNMCTMVNCGHSGPMRAEVKQMMQDGKSDEAITASFVQKYGSVVLSAPTTRGFDLTAWIMPFVALATGLLVVVFVARKWLSRAPEAATSGPVDVKYQSRVEEELKKYTPED